MKNLYLSIPRPCSEKWNNLTPTSKGGMCSTCNKVVMDFTNMSDNEIFDFISSNPTHTCGRFRSDQLKFYPSSVPVKINPGLSLLKAGLLSLLFLLISKQTSAQTPTPKSQTEVAQPYHTQTDEKNSSNTDKLIRGIVRSEDDHSAMPGINVVLKGTTRGTATDVDGRFELSGLKAGDVLIFSFIGYRTKEFVIPETSGQTLEIPLSLCMDVEIMGELAIDGIYLEKESGFRSLWTWIKSRF